MELLIVLLPVSILSVVWPSLKTCIDFIVIDWNITQRLAQRKQRYDVRLDSTDKANRHCKAS